MTRFDAETCSVAWPGLELAIHSGTVRDLAFVSRASGTPVLVSGGAGMYHFCVVLLRPRLHGSGQIFAWTNFVPAPPVYMDPCKFCCSGVYTDLCKV